MTTDGTLRIGLIARNDARGLGHITREFFRHMNPTKTLVIEPVITGGHDQHRDWYPATGDRTVAFVKWESELPEANMRRWLDGINVLYTAESFYDWRTVGWAREMGVATVMHANPEFYRADDVRRWAPTAVWNQSPWRNQTLRTGARFVPVPVATDRFEPGRRGDGPLRVLHFVGPNAAHARNGTPAFLRALSFVTQPVDVTIVTQGARVTIPKYASHVTVTPIDGKGDYWNLYRGHDVLVSPRRYGGQHLPTQEAMAAGLAVVMTDCPPNDSWDPVIRVDAARTGAVDTPGGRVDVWDVCPWTLASAIDELAVCSPCLADAKQAGLKWASANSWDTLAPLYRDLLGGIAGDED